MALVDLNFDHFYRPSIKASLPCESVPKALTTTATEVLMAPLVLDRIYSSA